MLSTLPHRSLAKLAKKYGPIMHLRLGILPTTIISSPEAAELILKQHDLIFCSRAPTLATFYMWYGTKGFGLTPYGDYWRRARRISTLHVFTTTKVVESQGLRKREIEGVVRWLKRAAESREVVDLSKKVGELIEEIMFKMLLGKNNEVVEDQNMRGDLKELMEEVVNVGGTFNLGDFLPFLAPLDLQGLTRKMKNLTKRVDKIFDKIIEDHLKEDIAQKKDVLSNLLSIMSNPNNEFFLDSFGRDNVKAIMLDLFTAGIDTSSHTLVWALSALLSHPRVMNLLQEELDAIVTKNRMVKESDLPNLPYLDMVVKETLRLYPTVPLLLPRECLEDVVVDGFTIRKNTRILINYWAIARDTKLWSKNSEEFFPERFINSDIHIRGPDFMLIPFGAGRRGCPGMQLGLATVKIVLAQMVHCFNWELPDGVVPEEMDMTERFGFTMPRTKKLLAIPSYRLPISFP